VPRFDATTIITRIPRHRPTTDLWDDLLRIAGTAELTQARTRVGRNAHWLLPMLAGALVFAAGLSAPGLWTDEFATWGMATAPWHEFWWVLRYVDAVLAPYYVLMHGWVTLFGDSDLALRAPSVAAMVISAGLIASLGARLAGRRTGLLAGLVFVLLPATSRFAAEARPYALGVLAAVVATYLLVLVFDQPSSWWRWTAYGAAVVALGSLHIVGLLLVVAHLWVVLAWQRRLWWRLILACVPAAAASVPLLIFGVQQRNQVAYIPRVSMASLAEYTGVVLGGTALTLLVVVLALFAMPLRYPWAVFSTWAVAPVLALTLFSLALPMFLPRYLLYTAPAWALLAGAALARPRRPAFALSALVLLAALAVPAHLAMRRDDGHQQASNTFAGIVTAQSLPGDGIVYADDEPTGSWTGRDMIAHYVPPAARPRDVLATNPPRHDGLLLATESRAAGDIAAALSEVDRLWVVRMRVGADPLAGMGPGKEKVLRERYDVAYVWRSKELTLALLQRKG
jgi:mannosyltransferase